MNALVLLALLVPQDEQPDWIKLVLVLLFFAMPALGGLLKKVFQPGGDQTREARGDGSAAAERRRLAREERRRAEAEGQDLWRRLASGEETAAEPPAPPQALVPARPSEAESEPAPLAMLGEVSEPSEASEVSLEQESEPEPLGAMVAGQATEVPPEPARKPFRLAGGDLRRGVVLAELLGPPLSLRGG